MEKLRAVFKYISGINLAYILVLALMIKAVISDVSYPTFLLTIPILCFEGYKLYIKSKKPDPVVFDAELRKELENIKSKVNANSLDKNINAPMKRYF